MQTNFTAKQLRDPRIAEVDKILRKCVHCGFCTATCPTYVLLGDERDSPRGRIYLIKEMFERGRKASAPVQHHVDRCLSCLSCMTTCPSGVDYMHLVDHAREHIESTARRGFKERLVRWLLASTVPYPERFRLALRGARLVRPMAGFLRRLGLPQLAAMLELAPPGLLMPTGTYSGPGTAATKGERRKRVILLAGCAQQVLRPEINDATIRLLARRGVDVEVAPGAGCCGALVHHMGREAAAIDMAKRNVDAWTRLIDKSGPVDAVIINTSGCGTTVKDYGHLLKQVSKYAEKAAKIAGLARDVTEFLSTYEMGPPKRWSSLRVAYHSACSMQHGQRIIDDPRKLLRNAGFTVMEIPEGHICCGSAGTYNILQPAIAAELRQRKVEAIRSVRPDLVATGNIGCITQIAAGMDIPIAHTVELLDWAYGGPIPRGLEALSRHVKNVPEPKPQFAVT
jgi:glycolate dehydrogenase iron-sulfur subunit